MKQFDKPCSPISQFLLYRLHVMKTRVVFYVILLAMKIDETGLELYVCVGWGGCAYLKYNIETVVFSGFMVAK